MTQYQTESNEETNRHVMIFQHLREVRPDYIVICMLHYITAWTYPESLSLAIRMRASEEDASQSPSQDRATRSAEREGISKHTLAQTMAFFDAVEESF